jgi:hypothetical protein
VPNQDLPDVYNTVLKMSGKRAMVDAVLKLPLVSELFTQDLEEQIADNVKSKADTKQTRRQEAPKPAPVATKPDGPNAQVLGEIYTLCTELNKAQSDTKWTKAELNAYAVVHHTKDVDAMDAAELEALKSDLQDQLDALR